MARIVLLTAWEYVPHVAPPLTAAGAQVAVAITGADLDHALATGTADLRLISFGSGVIVPEATLRSLPGPAYNIHSGPPSLPGLFPSVYALYERHATYGVTLHEMAPEVDSGPIVAVDTFAIPAACDRLGLDSLTFGAMLAMVARLAPALADVAVPLPRNGAAWSGPRRTRTDFNALCDMPADADAEEFFHRLRAVGEGPNHALTISRFGRRFRLVSEQGGMLTRGGIASESLPTAPV